MDRDPSQFVQALKRIPLFQGLKPDQALVLIRVCEQKALGAREFLCHNGDSANEMYILLSGQLSVRTKEAVQVARIDPIAPVGEMGIFTGEPRSADVIALEPSNMLVLSKAKLLSLMRRHPDIEIAISRNLIATLSQRLRDANNELVHLHALISDQEAGQKALQQEQ
ncbi:MAG: cyclic nucleotide-binding domain-containing protein [bacterium]|nr:cyclic nucleotide-binding domain-containing protein [bacterium]